MDQHLRHLGHDMPTLLARRQCEMRTWSETYLRGGRFDQDAMLELLDEFLVARRSPRIRMVADMGWVVGQQNVSDLLIEFDRQAQIKAAQDRQAEYRDFVAQMEKKQGEQLTARAPVWRPSLSGQPNAFQNAQWCSVAKSVSTPGCGGTND